jgi:hypothetical protein
MRASGERNQGRRRKICFAHLATLQKETGRRTTHYFLLLTRPSQFRAASSMSYDRNPRVLKMSPIVHSSRIQRSKNDVQGLASDGGVSRKLTKQIAAADDCWWSAKVAGN